MLEGREMYGDVIPIPREELISEWRSDPGAIIQQAEESEMELAPFLEVRGQPTEEDHGPITERLLEATGIRMEDSPRGHIPSTPLSRLPGINPNPSEPEGHLVNAYLDQRCNDVLLTGERSINSISGLTTNSVWRPYYDEPAFRQPQIAPAFDFRNIIGRFRTISDDQYRLNKRTNAKAEQQMQKAAESTLPDVFVLDREDKAYKLIEYRAGIEATDNFLRGSDVRASDVTNAVEEIAIGHRITLLRDAAMVITTDTPSGNDYAIGTATLAGVPHVAGNLEYPFFVQWLTDFGTAYKCDCIVGNQNSITNLKLMSLSAGDNLTLGSWATLPNSNIVDFNGGMMDLGFGWIDSDSDTGFKNNKLWGFQKATSLIFVQRRGMNQDETQRDAGMRTMTRWFGTQSRFISMDTNGMRSITFGT